MTFIIIIIIKEIWKETETMNKINEMISNLDAKIDPKLGNTLRKVFMIISLILILVVLPVIALVVGSFEVIPGIITISSTTLICAGFIPWLVLVITFSSLWFYFSKWTNAEQ